MAENGKLKKVWSVQEGAGPVRSAAYVVPAESGRHQDILYIEGFAPGGDEADSLEAQRLVWDESPQTMRVRLVARLPAVVVGEFPTVPAARATASGSCIAEYWVLPAGGFGGSGSSFVLALVVADRQTAEAEMARKCDVVPPRRIAEFHPIEDMK